MSTWINKKLISFSEKVIENVIDSFTNKNTPIDNIQNMQGTQLGKIINKVISSKYFFKNDDICYNKNNLDFKWYLKKDRKKSRKIKKKQKKRKRKMIMMKRGVENVKNADSSNNDVCHDQNNNNFNDPLVSKNTNYNYLYTNNNENNMKESTFLKIDESYLSTSYILNGKFVSGNNISDNKNDLNEKKYINIKRTNSHNDTSSLSISQNNFSKIKKKKGASSINSYDESSPNVSPPSMYSSENLSYNEKRHNNNSDNNNDRNMKSYNYSSSNINKNCSSSSTSSSISSSSISSSNGNDTSLLLSSSTSSCNTKVSFDNNENYGIIKEFSLCKINLFIKEAKLLFFNKNISISDVSLYVTTIMEDKKYIGKLRKLSSRTLPMNNLIINEYINHNIKDVYTDIIINIRYKNRKKEKEDIILGRAIIPLFLILNTYKWKIKKIKNKIRYCTKCFLWLHIFPCNNKLFNYKFFKPVEGFEEYGMLNPLYTLGFLNIQIKIIFKRNPLFLTFLSNIRKPLFYYKLPVQFEPLYCQYYSENLYVYAKNIPLWIYKFFYIFHYKRLEMISLNCYDYICILIFWLFFFDLVVLSPFSLIFVHLFFCIFFISLSYKYGKFVPPYYKKKNLFYNFRPIRVSRVSRRNCDYTKRRIETTNFILNDQKNVEIYNREKKLDLLDDNNVDANYCKYPYCSEENNMDKLNKDGRDVNKGVDKNIIKGKNMMTRGGGLNIYDACKMFIKGDTVMKANIINDNIVYENFIKDGIKKNDVMMDSEEDKEINAVYINNKNVYNNNNAPVSCHDCDDPNNLSVHVHKEENNSTSNKMILPSVCSENSLKETMGNQSMENNNKINNENNNDVDSVEKTDILLNLSNGKNNEKNNMSYIARRIQNMMYDTKEKMKLDQIHMNKHMSGFMKLFNVKHVENEKENDIDKYHDKGESDKQVPSSVGSYKLMISQEAEFEEEEFDEKEEFDEEEEEGGQDEESKKMSRVKHIKKRENIINIEGENILSSDGKKSEYIIKDSMNNTEYINDIIYYNNCDNILEDNKSEYNTSMNERVMDNKQEVNKRSNNFFFSYNNNNNNNNNNINNNNNNKNESVWRNLLGIPSSNIETVNLNSNNCTEIKNNKSNIIDLRKKYPYMPFVKSPFHNFYLYMNTNDNKNISIFSNNVEVPNVHVILNRFITLITWTQHVSGIFTMVYEKIKYAFNWEFSFYTLVNILILFLICYSISFIIYMFSYIPFVFFRFLFFVTCSYFIIRSYELTEDGNRACLYYKKRKIQFLKNRKISLAHGLFETYKWKNIIKIIKKTLKKKDTNIFKYICLTCAFKIYKLFKIIFENILLYILFILFFIKNWYTRLLILKDIEHMQIAKLQGFKNLYFFIHNRIIKREQKNVMSNTSSNEINNRKSSVIKIVNIDDMEKNEENMNKNDNNHDKNDDINYKNLESYVYSSSDKEAVNKKNINTYQDIHIDQEIQPCDDENDDKLSLSQVTDNGAMNVNVDIFLHYYFKKRKYDLFNNFININRNHMYTYKDINLFYSNEDQKMNNINYGEYLNSDDAYSSSYDYNKRQKKKHVK
ncbi:hypothetical protein PFFVO_05553 [Plasmodium falciparum Vietnam Oak-Knoll (FVO)]|uniref:Uncharacterized protein n=1 Tax=Plasmodium falciparum Vietnam Oak-Knoll (FVO) TaxID=1036723 RepID=A0A024UYG1_PLAFA|nr:hypothetical protein PFFVO_05553 [Plasmodium falciparum Vietnam Oak-Knoll (FVO)]